MQAEAMVQVQEALEQEPRVELPEALEATSGQRAAYQSLLLERAFFAMEPAEAEVLRDELSALQQNPELLSDYKKQLNVVFGATTPLFK